MGDFNTAASLSHREAEIDQLYKETLANPAVLIESFKRNVPDEVLEGWGGYSNSAQLNAWQKGIDGVLKKMNPAQMLDVLSFARAQADDSGNDKRHREIAEAVRQEIDDMTDTKYPRKIRFERIAENDHCGIAGVLARHPGVAMNTAEVLVAEAARDVVPSAPQPA